ncbi:PKD domain-containing protein [Nocardioides rotundus]|uniref:PKD domain-containing protein n=1 Tax=Nocardioides rotundus TaxID=1774216 RepID=UPI001CC016AE|nr:PKD domain-containing protein [Nocardioides rotundus]UAL30592.1 PKD domain-containing protein [Nocardioides rotundus]
MVVGLFLSGLGSAAADTPAAPVVSEVPARSTPDVRDGAVNSIAKVGSLVVLGGTFTSANDPGATTGVPRSSLLAFDASTGQISRTFAPAVDGPVEVVIPAGDGVSVFVGGNFRTIGGVARKNLARVRVDTGQVMPFDAGNIAGKVNDLRLAGGRLWVGGAFTHVAGRAQAALATVNPSTGAFDPYMGLVVAGVHQAGYPTTMKMDVTPDGSALVLIGNFDTVSGLKRHQIAKLDLTGAQAALSNWQTGFYEASCNPIFYSYMRDLDISPDGRYFVVTTTGSYGGSTGPCDTAARFEVGSTKQGDPPSWVDYTGGDTSFAVEVTPEDVVYVGGHQRWWNNPYGADRAAAGAVSRAGIAALDGTNGLPLSWNPTRDRGVGVFDFMYTPQGLWVGSDTTVIGGQPRGRIALMPLPGSIKPATTRPTLPNRVYTGGVLDSWGRVSDQLVQRQYGGTGAAPAPASSPRGNVAWTGVRGGFMINGQLYLGHSDGSFSRRSFDGTSYGTPVAVDTQDELVSLSEWHNDVARITAMFFDNGRLYYTMSGSSALYYRYFEPESDVVGAKRLTAPTGGLSLSSIRGMFVAGTSIYVVQSNGSLQRAQWSDGAVSGSPAPGTTTTLTGGSGQSWGGRAVFVYQGAVAETPPAASFGSTCAGTTCQFDASESSAGSVGSITSYAWTFGDGTTGSGVAPEHTYTAAGTYSVTLRVTTSSGRTASMTREVQATRPNAAPTAAMSVSCDNLTCVLDGSGSSDPEGDPLTFGWDFGDGESGSGVSVTHSFPTSGTYPVRLTVSDGGSLDTVTREVTVRSGEQAALTQVASVGTGGNRLVHDVAIPAGVRAGDVLVLAMTSNTNAAITPPPGWTLAESVDGTGVSGRLWTRVATSADAGRTVSATTDAYSKSTLTVSAYRGSAGAQVTDTAGSLQNTASIEHPAPTVQVSSPGSWVVTVWSEKSSVAEPMWRLPSDAAERTRAASGGAGKVSTVVADSGSPAPIGAWSAGTASTVEVTKATAFSVVIQAK